MKRLVIIVTLSTFLSSCGAGYIINVKNDGSASVSMTRDLDTSHVNIFFNSDIISNIDTNASWVYFDISNIDSLGEYLSNHPPGFFELRMDSTTFTLTEGHTKAFKTSHKLCCSVQMSVTFDRDILYIESENSQPKQKDERSIEVFRSRRQLIKGKKKTNLMVKLKTKE